MTARRTIRRIGAALAVVAIGLTVAMAAPALAERWNDRGSDNQEMERGDISRVHVDHAPRKVFTKVRFHDGHGDVNRVYLDTRRDNRGPEFKAWIRFESGTHQVLDRGLNRVGAFNRVGKRLDCNGLRIVRAKENGLRYEIPRRCLKIEDDAPKSVRASVHTVSLTEGPSGARRMSDWAPAPFRFGPWLGRG